MGAPEWVDVFRIENGDIPTKNMDCPIKNGDDPIKHGDFPVKPVMHP